MHDRQPNCLCGLAFLKTLSVQFALVGLLEINLKKADLFISLHSFSSFLGGGGVGGATHYRHAHQIECRQAKPGAEFPKPKRNLYLLCLHIWIIETFLLVCTILS